MEIIALAYKTKAKSDFDNSVLYVFFQPAWGGNHIVEAELLIREDDLADYKTSLLCNSYAEAHMKANIKAFYGYRYAELYPEYFKEASKKQQLKED